MAVSDKAFNAIVERCRLALRLTFRQGTEYQAERLFDEELRLIRKRGFEKALVEIVEFGDRLHQQTADAHVIGAGGSSVVLYLLGFSEVDPVRYRTHFQRFWSTSNNEPPTVQFVVLPAAGRSWSSIPSHPNVTAHPMAALEAVPAILRRRLPEVWITPTEKTVFQAIQRADTEGVFQLEAEPVRTWLSQVSPRRIKAIAAVTALEQIRHSHPEVVELFRSRLQERASAKGEEFCCLRGEKPMLPILFQETIMERLHWQARFPWEATYRFVQAAAKGNSVRGVERTLGMMTWSDQDHTTEVKGLLDQLAKASQWAVCRAHHVANAITSYRAAYYRTFHRQAFEVALQQVTDWE